MQTVNLYHARFRKQQPVFLADTLVRAVGAVLVGLVLIGAYAGWVTVSLEKRVSDLRWQRSSATHQLAEIDRDMAIRAPDPQLIQEVEHLRSLEAGKREQLKQLGAQRVGNTDGFAAQLDSLARQKPAALWLTHIHFGNGGNNIELIGSTYEAGAVPKLLKNLANEPLFAGLVFEQFEMSGGETPDGKVCFTIRTNRTNP